MTTSDALVIFMDRFIKQVLEEDGDNVYYLNQSTLDWVISERVKALADKLYEETKPS